MTMDSVRPYTLEFPAGGISDARARSKHDLVTTEEGINVRNIDPATGRDGGAVRAGLSKLVAGRVYDAPSGGSSGSQNPAVRALQRLVYDSRRTTYEAVDTPSGGSSGTVQVATPEQVWAAGSPNSKEFQRLLVDPYGNVYGLARPSTVAKFNASGRLICSFDLPIDHEDQLCRAFAIDSAGGLYVATSHGPQTAKRMLWRLLIDEFDQFYIDWSIEFEGYIPDLAVRDNYLYVLENISLQASTTGFPSQRLGSSHLNVYDSLDTVEPRLLWYRSVPYDALKIAVRSDGDMFVTCRENPFRDDEAQDAASSTDTIDWTPNMLANWDTRKWAWFDARAIDYLAGDDEVRVWEDRTGNRRHLFYWTGDEIFTTLGLNPPIYKAASIAGHPAVRFTGDSCLASADTFNVNAESELASNLSLIPSVQGRSWTMFMVIAPKRGGRDRGCVWEQWGDVGWRLVTNEDDAADGTVVPGALRLACTKADASANGPGADQIDAGVYTNSTAGKRQDVCVVCIRMGGDDEAAPSGGYSGAGSGAGVPGSRFRVNGAEVDRWTTTEDKIRYPSFLGYPIVDDGINGDNKPGGFEGDIAEIITIRDSTADPDIDIGEIEQLEGYLAHKWGIQHALDAGHPYKATPPTAPSGGPSADVPESPTALALRSTNPLVVKIGANTGQVVWVFSGSAAGKNITVDDDGGVYLQGYVQQVPSGGPSPSGGSSGSPYNISVRKLVDEGTAYSLGWEIDTSVIPETDYQGQLHLDSEGNLYVPGHTVTSDVARHTFFKINPSGQVEWAWDAPADTYAGKEYDSYDFALDPKTPDFDDDTIGEPEHLYVCTYFHDNGDTLYKLRMVGATQESGSPRTIVYPCVCNGDVRVVDPAGGTVSTPTGGAAALLNTSEFIAGTVLYGEAFFTDGEKIVVYNPRDNAVVDYVPNSAGEMPRRPRLLSRWRGALWTARFDGSPHEWFITARGDPYDVDINPPVTLATQAVLGSDSRAGLCPDIINALIPYDDDLAIFGCDASIHRMTGDPMAGGVFDLVTDEVGVAFGSPWCKDPEGGLYFLSTGMRVYRMEPGGKPVLISDRRIDRRLAGIDLADYDARMAWNRDADGIDLFFVPRGTPTGRTTHFFWERGSVQTPFNAWWETHFDSDDLQPTCVLVGDGDEAADRVVLIGSADGYLRQWDSAAEDDDGTAIRASVVLGPISQSIVTRMGWSWLQVMIAGDEEAGPVRAELLTADSPRAIPETPKHVIEIQPGNAKPSLKRCRGQSFWVRLSSLSATRRWRFESATIMGWPMGRVR